jgi:oxidase EvaA
MKIFNKLHDNLFLKSALSITNTLNSLEYVLDWVKKKNEEIVVEIDIVPFREMENWDLDKDRGILKHKSGNFFSIEGVNINTNWGDVCEWDQPIINQPEIGYLGIITKEISGILYFLLQAKIEPGNINYVQLSPTLQATKSNYSQVHHGKKPMFLEYFQNATPDQILLDQLQSEQGARFLKKRNRNIIIKVNEQIELPDNYIWLTLAQIKALLNYNNIVNMDTRTVISGITYSNADKSLFTKYDFHTFSQQFLLSILSEHKPKNSLDNILMWLTSLKSKYDLTVTSKSIMNLNSWIVSDTDIHHVSNSFFKVIATNVKISNREVSSWSQPLILPAQQGLICFVIKFINNTLHFLVQAKVEPGNFDIVELAPTVQCMTGSYEDFEQVPFLKYVLNATAEQILHDSLQSEEGGRFYHEENRNMLILADESINDNLPLNFKWISFSQLTTFLKFNNFLNIQARSLISLINLN